MELAGILCRPKRHTVHIKSTEVCYGALRKLISVSEELSDFLESPEKEVFNQSCPSLGSESEVTGEMSRQSDQREYNLTSAGTVKSLKTTQYATEASKKTSPTPTTATSGHLSGTLQTTVPQPRVVKPLSRYANLILCGLKPGQGRTGVMATILLDNPAGRITLSYTAFVHNVQCVFGLRGTNLRMFHDPAFTQELATKSRVHCLSQKTIFVCPPVLFGVAQCSVDILSGPLCRYVNLSGSHRRGTLLLENPSGDAVTWSEIVAQASVILGVPVTDIRLSRTRNTSGIVKDEKDLGGLQGSTVFAL